jgi:hypothetical protein
MNIIFLLSFDLSIKLTVGVWNSIADLILNVSLVECELKFDCFDRLHLKFLIERTVSKPYILSCLLKLARNTLCQFFNIRLHAFLIETLFFRNVHDAKGKFACSERFDST